MTADGFYHCSVKSVGRGNGASIVAKSAYRAGVRIEDERTGDVADYRARGGVAETFTVARDGVTPPDIGKLWNDAERAEVRTNGRLATETVIAFPQEFDAATRRKLGEEFARSIVGKHGIVAQVSIHAPDREGDARNWHAHILFSHREFGPDGFGDIANTRTMTRKRKGREVQEQIAGIAATPADIKTIRKEWEQTVNREYERQGLDIRIDHRSHKDRGLDQEPTKHLGPTASQMERDEPGLSDRAAVNREITQRNAARILAAMREAEVSQIKAEIIDLKADLAMQESRDAAQGRTDDVRPVFTAAAARTTEPAAEIFDRDAANRAADDRIVDAAIANAEAQKARQQPGADAGRETRGGEVDPSGGPEAERAAEREQARPASRIESRIADCAEKAARLGATVLEDASGRRVDRVEALADYFRPDDERQTHAVTVHGREAFAARLEDVGIALVRVTETDAKALAALREQEEFDRASGLAHKPRRRYP
jgi:hypothetical protein